MIPHRDIQLLFPEYRRFEGSTVFRKKFGEVENGARLAPIRRSAAAARSLSSDRSRLKVEVEKFLNTVRAA